MYILLLLMQIFFFISGSIFLYFSIFSYETDDEKIQDKLEEFWINLKDFESGIFNKLKLIIKESNHLILEISNKLFGNKIISWRFIKMSTIISLIGIYLLIGLIGIISSDALSIVLGFFFISTGLFGLTNNLNPKSFGKKYIMEIDYIVIVSGFFIGAIFINMAFFSDTFYTIVVSVCMNALFTIFIRKLLLSIGAVYPFLTSILIPIIFFSIFNSIILFLSYSDIMYSPLLILLLNLPSIIFATLLLFIPFLLINGFMFFGFFNRLLYSVQRNRIVYNKKTLWGISFLLYGMIPFIATLPIFKHS